MARPKKVQPSLNDSIVYLGDVKMFNADGEAGKMNAYALRIWEGQSSSLALIERVARIKKGLAGQGWTDLSALELPDAGFRKYM